MKFIIGFFLQMFSIGDFFEIKTFFSTAILIRESSGPVATFLINNKKKFEIGVFYDYNKSDLFDVLYFVENEKNN